MCHSAHIYDFIPITRRFSRCLTICRYCQYAWGASWSEDVPSLGTTAPLPIPPPSPHRSRPIHPILTAAENAGVLDHAFAAHRLRWRLASRFWPARALPANASCSRSGYNARTLLYVLAITTGMRQGELFALKWQDVDLGNATLSVRRTLTRSGERYTLGETKKSRRTVRLTQKAVEALRSHRTRQLEEKATGGRIRRLGTRICGREG